jgi:hypothetical protein
MWQRDWKESWVDQMGLIVALGGKQRFEALDAFKLKMFVTLTPEAIAELRECLRQRFTPTNGGNGCASATAAVKEVVTA